MATAFGFLATAIDEKNKELEKMRSATPEEVKSVNAYVDNISQTVLTIPIPDNATNGDVIKALYNPYRIFEYVNSSVHVYLTEDSFNIGEYEMNFNWDWWNAPYRREAE